MNWGEGFLAMNAKDIVLPKRDLDCKASIKRRLVKKGLNFSSP